MPSPKPSAHGAFISWKWLVGILLATILSLAGFTVNKLIFDRLDDLEEHEHPGLRRAITNIERRQLWTMQQILLNHEPGAGPVMIPDGLLELSFNEEEDPE